MSKYVYDGKPHQAVVAMSSLIFSGNVDLANRVCNIISTSRKELIDDVRYRDWIVDWKFAIKAIEQLRRNVKMFTEGSQSNKDRALHSLTILANIMLNARQYHRACRARYKQRNENND